MPRPGCLMILANVEAEAEDEFNRWYDEEHMRERVDIPGFVAAQRYVSPGAAQLKYLALYETKSLSTFTSEPYRRALDNQSDWSRRVLTTFRDPQRCVGEIVARAGYGTGRAVSLLRLRPVAPQTSQFERHLTGSVLPDCVAQRGVVSASLLRADPQLSRPVAEYPKDGLQLLRPDDWFLAIGASHPSFLPVEPLAEIPEGLIEEAATLGTFEILWDLHRSDLPGED